MIKILHVIPYDLFFPPDNGGALRCYHISQELVKHAGVSVLSLQDQESFFTQNGYGWDERIRLITPEKKRRKFFGQSIFNAVYYRWIRKKIRESADTIVLELYPALKNLLKREQFDVIIFEHLIGEKLSFVARKYAPTAKVIIDQHNVDYLLNTLENPGNIMLIDKTLFTEKTLHQRVNEIWVCSQRDQSEFLKLNDHKLPVHVIPNGVDTSGKKFNHSGCLNNKSIIFCGALTTRANMDGLLWFYHEIWPILNQVDGITFTVIGKNSNHSNLDVLKEDQSVNFIGEVKNLEEFYHKNHVAIVPIRIGSGTRIKILEAMSYGNPVVSTSKGAEGIDYTLNEDILIADQPEDFAGSILRLFDNPALSEKLRKNGRELVEKVYSWDKIGEKIALAIGQPGCFQMKINNKW